MRISGYFTRRQVICFSITKSRTSSVSFSSCCNTAVVELLLARGADPNARDKSRGSTPLRRAVSGTGAGGTAGTADLMMPLTRLLLAYGADPDARDKRGVPVHASAEPRSYAPFS